MKEAQHAIAVRDLRKEYRGTRAVDGVSFDVRQGTITGFLGPNGAGKTTTLRMILGLVRPTSGDALLWGRPYTKVGTPSRRIGVCLDAGAFVGGRTGRNHLRCFARAAGCGPERIETVLSLVGLEAAAGRPAAGYSTGMKQRLSLATALLGDPDLLILDEPVNGLDPEGILWLRQFLRNFAHQGRTVLLSSHLLAEMEQTVDEVLLMHRGRLLCQSPLPDLLHADQCVVRGRTAPGRQLYDWLAGQGHECVPLPDGRVWVGSAPPRVRDAGRAAGIPADDLQVEPCGLESVFMRLTRAAEGVPA